MKEVIELLRDLVRTPSLNARVNGGEGEQRAAEYLAGWLAARGVACRVERVGSDTYSLIAHVPSKRAKGRLLLCSHLDTVAVAGHPAPFDPGNDAGVVFGRGACDAKASVAVMAQLMAEAVRRPPGWDLTFAAVGDEEVTSSGVRHLTGLGERYDGAVVGEPSGCRLMLAHGGALRVRADLRGRSAHSSVPEQGASALLGAVSLVAHLERWHANAHWPDHPLVGRPSLTPTRLDAGVGVNVVPDAAKVVYDRRTVPPEDAQAVLASLRAAASAAPLPAGVELRWEVLQSVPWLDTPVTANVASAMAQAMERAGLDPRPVGARYGSDASRLAATGTAAVVFGPGDIAFAHSPKEQVAVDDIARAHAALSALIWPS